MNRLVLRPWESADQILQWIGRCATRRLKRRHSTPEESTAYATIGGAIICAVLGGVAGFALFDSSRNIDAIDGTIFGTMLGLCTGIMFGAFVETVDHTIKDLLKSLGSK
jgi:uncharacterized protein YcfJ